MLNEIIKGISIKLNGTFGDDYRVYQNDVKQGLKEPCFFIHVLNPTLDPLLGGRSLKRNLFDVRYHPRISGNNVELYDMGDTLMDCLEYITLPNGDLMRGIGMNFEVVDDVLHFFVNYHHTTLKPCEAYPMEVLKMDVGAEKG